MTSETIQTRELSHTSAQSTKPVVAALSAALLGLTIIFAVGFIQGPNAAAHEMAHDTRHAMGFPCH